MIDWTIHIGDLVTLGSIVGAGTLYVVRAMRDGYRHMTTELEVHREELEDHRSLLKTRVGWRPDPDRGLSRTKGAA